MIDRNSIIKNSEKIFQNACKKNSLKIPFRFREIVKKTEDISSSFGVIDNIVYSKSKSVNFIWI